jgi:hypothetical protein
VQPVNYAQIPFYEIPFAGAEGLAAHVSNVDAGHCYMSPPKVVGADAKIVLLTIALCE